MTNKTTQVLIVEDEVIIAHNIKLVLAKLGYGVSAITDSATEAVELAQKKHPDLVLMDIMLTNRGDGIDAAEQILSQLNIPVVFLTAYFDDATLDKAQLVYPSGYITKPFQDKDLNIAIKMALFKHQRFNSQSYQIMSHLKQMGTADLTIREKEICCLVKGGFNDEEIASNLYISPHTVKTHMKSIYKKFGVSTRSKLMAKLNAIVGQSAPMN